MSSQACPAKPGMEPRLRGHRQAPGVPSSLLCHLWLGGDISREALSCCLRPPHPQETGVSRLGLGPGQL